MNDRDIFIHGDLDPQSMLVDASDLADVKVHVTGWEVMRHGQLLRRCCFLMAMQVFLPNIFCLTLICTGDHISTTGSAAIDVAHYALAGICFQAFCSPYYGSLLLSSLFDSYGLTVDSDWSHFDFVKMARHIAAGLLTAAHLPAAGYVQQGLMDEALETAVLVRVREWAGTLLRRCQSEDPAAVKRMLVTRVFGRDWCTIDKERYEP